MKNLLAAVLLIMGSAALSAAEGKPETVENILKEKGIVIAYPGWKLKRWHSATTTAISPTGNWSGFSTNME